MSSYFKKLKTRGRLVRAQDGTSSAEQAACVQRGGDIINCANNPNYNLGGSGAGAINTSQAGLPGRLGVVAAPHPAGLGLGGNPGAIGGLIMAELASRQNAPGSATLGSIFPEAFGGDDSIPADLLLAIACMNGDEAACDESSERQGGGGGAAVLAPQMFIPPVTEILAERRARRQALGQQLISAAAQNVPGGATFYPGFNPGGIADVLLGIASGKGTKAVQAEGLIPEGQRRVTRVNLPGQPTVEQDFGSSLALANRILANMTRVDPTVVSV